MKGARCAGDADIAIARHVQCIAEWFQISVQVRDDIQVIFHNQYMHKFPVHLPMRHAAYLP